MPEEVFVLSGGSSRVSDCLALIARPAVSHRSRFTRRSAQDELMMQKSLC